MPSLSEIVKLFGTLISIGGGIWGVLGIVSFAMGLHDKNGPEIQKGIFQTLGGVAIVAAGLAFTKIDTSGATLGTATTMIYNIMNW